MGYAGKNICVIGYQRVMGFRTHLGGDQLGSSPIVWVIGEYGLSGVWVIGDLTVYLSFKLEIDSSAISYVSLGTPRCGGPEEVAVPEKRSQLLALNVDIKPPRWLGKAVKRTLNAANERMCS